VSFQSELLELDCDHIKACQSLLDLENDVGEVSSGTETVTDNDWSTPRIRIQATSPCATTTPNPTQLNTIVDKPPIYGECPSNYPKQTHKKRRLPLQSSTPTKKQRTDKITNTTPADINCKNKITTESTHSQAVSLSLDIINIRQTLQQQDRNIDQLNESCRKLEQKMQLIQRLKRERQVSKILDQRLGMCLVEYKPTNITKEEYDILNWTPQKCA
jgi:hypothetical protein